MVKNGFCINIEEYNLKSETVFKEDLLGGFISHTALQEEEKKWKTQK
jgi:hypothetical protein